jgi:hypothetical protein
MKQERILSTGINIESLIITVKLTGLSETELKAKNLFYFHFYKAITGALTSNSNFKLFA